MKKRNDYHWKALEEYLGQAHRQPPRWPDPDWKNAPVHIIKAFGVTAPPPGRQYGDSTYLARCGVMMEFPQRVANVTPDNPQQRPPCPRCGTPGDFDEIEQAIIDRAARDRAQRESDQEPGRQEWEKGKGINHPPMPQCFSCGHSPRWLGRFGQYACTAYPSGIPQAIMENRYDHRTSRPGDKGLTWSPKHGLDESAHPLAQSQPAGLQGHQMTQDLQPGL